MASDNRSKSGGGRQSATLNTLILRSIVDHAVVTLDANGIITSWNEGAERVLGWTEDEIVGKSAEVFFTESDTRDHRPETEMRLAIENGRAEDVRWHVRKNGERFWGSGLMMPLLNDTDARGDAILDPGKIDGFVKIFRDRTAEHNAELKIQRLQHRATLAMRRSGTVGIFDNDLTTNIIIADHTCAKMHSVDVQIAETGAYMQSFIEGIVPEDQAKVKQSLKASIENGEDLDVIYRVTTHGKRPIWVQAQGTILRNENGLPYRLTGIVVDITAQREQLRMQEARLEFADKVRNMNNPDEIAALASRMIGETVYATRAGHGYVEDDGQTIDIKADWNMPGSQSLAGRHPYSAPEGAAFVLKKGEKITIGDTETDPRIDDPAVLNNLGIRALVHLPLTEHGKLKAVLFVNDKEPRNWSEAEMTFLGAMFDRTYAAMDRVKHETERNMLSEEMSHRMKNILTIAQVVVKQSLRKVPGLDNERLAIEARLKALSCAQDVLTRASDSGADILSVIEATLAPHLPQPGRIVVAGPSLPLQSQQVLGLSLALHELATNAAKYGALSNEDGQIHISWECEDRSFGFRWIEKGGPIVEMPNSQGFGSIILQRAVGGYFFGSSQLNFEASGVSFEISGELGK